MQFAVCGSHGNESPRLSVEVLSLQACVCKRTFDLKVTASTGKAAVVDHFVQGMVSMETAKTIATGLSMTWHAFSSADLQHNTLIRSEKERMLTVQYVQVSYLIGIRYWFNE